MLMCRPLDTNILYKWSCRSNKKIYIYIEINMPNLLHELAICWVIAAQQTLGDSSCQQTMEGRVTIFGDENPNIAPINLKKNTWKKVTHPNLSEDPIFRDLDSQGKINIPQKKSTVKIPIGYGISTLAVPSKSKIHAGKYTSTMRRLTWNLKIHPWKTKIIIFRFYANLRGCSWPDTCYICFV